MRKNLPSLFCIVPVCLSLLLLMGGCQRQPPADSAGTGSSEKMTTGETATPPASASDATEPAALTYINPLTPAEIEQGWILLFDNETLFGWKKQNAVNWAVQDQAITADKGPIGLLLTEVPFTDYELSVDFKAAPGCNAGVFLRCNDNPQNPATDCYEINIADAHPQGFLSGSIVVHAPADPGMKTTDNQWHHLRIRAVKNQFQVSIDDKQVLEFQDDRDNWLKTGLIGLQKNEGAIAYKNIKLKPLETISLFNGTDLTGWREVPGSKSVIDVVTRTIHVVNGPGFLETKETYQDFLLQFEAKTHAPELNSGLFFRAEQGTEAAPSNGYEVQIHNGFKNGDRNQPNNAGTGAIFRRVDARRVTADDNAWSTITLIAHGPRIATWVQGYPVVNWLDERQPDPNPRKGLRLEAGHLSLQGHDPTTDLSFRNFQLAETP